MTESSQTLSKLEIVRFVVLLLEVQQEEEHFANSKVDLQNCYFVQRLVLKGLNRQIMG